jgi:hypothetical protein
MATRQKSACIHALGSSARLLAGARWLAFAERPVGCTQSPCECSVPLSAKESTPLVVHACRRQSVSETSVRDVSISWGDKDDTHK